MSGLIWLALDGVGHPLDAPDHSPWNTALPTLRPLIDAGQALDAHLHTEGLPQSATGQTSWLTGENAARVMKGHYGPRPGPTLRAMLERSLPVRLTRAGGRTELLNFYPSAYFERTRPPTRNPYGCFPWSVLQAGRTLNPAGFPLVAPTLGLTFEAPHAPTTGLDHLRTLGEALGHAALQADLLILDLWFSDFLGHAGGPGERSELHAAARAYLTRLDALLEGLSQTGARLVVTSDHGNFENLGIKTHTHARVPFAGAGVELPAADGITEGAQAIAGLLGL